MKNKITKKVSYDKTIVESTICDICKKVYRGEGWEKKSTYDVLETEIRFKTGCSFPDGGGGEEITYDICPKCFKEKLIPILAELGANPTQGEWGW